jgi:hypothetical protein
MQNTGVSWVIYSMTHSTFMLGLALFSLLFPRFVLSLFGGIVSDRHNRYKILLITQIASMLQAALLATLTLSNHYAVWELLALSAILGIINAFDSPARQPLVHEMVFDKEDLPNAIALNIRYHPGEIRSRYLFSCKRHQLYGCDHFFIIHEVTAKQSCKACKEENHIRTYRWFQIYQEYA